MAQYYFNFIRKIIKEPSDVIDCTHFTCRNPHRIDRDNLASHIHAHGSGIPLKIKSNRNAVNYNKHLPAKT